MSKQGIIFFSGRAESVDLDDGIIKGVSLITEGEVVGHQCFADAKTNQTVLACCEKAEKVKVKLNHGADASTVIGVLKNFRIDGAQVKADLQLLKSSSYYDYIIELAKELSGHVGLSIAFKPSFENLNKKKFVRCESIYSADLVDSPAANPRGLFDNNMDAETKTKEEQLDLGGVSNAPAATAEPATAPIKSEDVSTICPNCQKTGDMLQSLNDLHNTATALLAEHKERFLRQSNEVAGMQDKLAMADKTILELQTQVVAIAGALAEVKEAARTVELMRQAIDAITEQISADKTEFENKIKSQLETEFSAKFDAQKVELENQLKDANILASRKVASLGIDLKTIPSAAVTQGVVSILETLNAIENPMEKNAFYQEHKQEIFKAQQAEINKRILQQNRN